MRKFEIVSEKEFLKTNTLEEYKKIVIPKRATNFSAGYDFYLPYKIVINPNESVLIKTGIKAMMNSDEVLILAIRSSLGVKKGLQLNNQIGIIDSDYYNNSNNEGHIFVKLYNEGKEKFCVNKKDRLCQGIFTKFLTVSNEEKINNVRTNGFGSTGKGE